MLIWLRGRNTYVCPSDGLAQSIKTCTGSYICTRVSQIKTLNIFLNPIYCAFDSSSYQPVAEVM